MDSSSATTLLEAPPAPARSGSRRILAISSSLVGTQAATSALGLLFWTIAARQFSVEAVGVAGAAVALMILLGTLGSGGLGTLLIARLPHTEQGVRRVLVRTSLLLAGVAAGVLALVVPLVAIGVFGAANLEAVAGTPALAVLFAVGTAATAAAIVVDQSVLVLGNGSLQLERNVVASVTKVLALVGLAAADVRSGMAVFLAWTVGTLVSFPVTAWRTRGGRPLETGHRLVHLRMMRGLGAAAAGHHALNTTLMAPLLLLPLIVTLTLSARANGVFSTAVQVTGLVFALPYAMSVGLFAAAEGDERQVLDRMRITLGLGLGISLLANLALFPLAPVVLSVFGPEYAAEGADVLRILCLAGLAFVVKDHFVALRRVQGRTVQAASALAGFTVVELAVAAGGARAGGTVGLCVAWVSVLAVEAVILAVPLARGYLAARTPAAVETVMPTAAATAAAAATSSGTHERSHRPGRMAGTLAQAVGVGPALLLMALGLLALAHAVDLARAGTGAGTAPAWYVAGLVAIVLPAALGALLPGVSRRGRILLAVAMPVALQLSRVVLYPDRFMFHDELIHANLLRQLDSGAPLFGTNPLLPITAYYPGLEIATVGVQSLTGIPAHASAVVILVAARAVVALAIVALVRRITGSTRAAAAASVVYACNPQFLFFNSQYSYQTLALPLAVLTVYVAVARRRGSRFSLVLPLLTMAAVVVTHHVTAGLLVAGFAVWSALEALLQARRTNDSVRLGLIAVAGAVMLGISVLNPGNTLGGYLGSIAESSGTDLGRLASGTENKQMFRNSAGITSAPWEQALILASLAITVLVLVPALFAARTWFRRRTSVAVALCLAAALYPIIPAGHLTRATAEVGDRAAGFVFVGVAFVVGWWVSRRPPGALRALGFAAGAVVVFLGSVILGAGPVAAQLPGPFRVSADARSVDPVNLAAARWMAANLPPESRVYANRVTGLLAASDGGQYTVRHVSTGIDASRLLLDPDFGQADVTLIRQARIRYLIVDRRDAYGLPNEQFYIESGEFGGENRTTPVSAAALRKFDAVPGVDRIYDNGSVVVYDLGELDRAR